MKKENIKFYVNNSSLFQKKINTSETLDKIHEMCKLKIPDDAIFLSSDGCEIDTSDESDYTASEIMTDGIIYLNSKTYQNNSVKPKIVKKNVPIPGSEKVATEKGLDLYLYPQIKFTEEQVKKAIKIMVVGQTGSGKTTLLNSFINYLLGVQFEDNFRYKIIHEDFGPDRKQDESQTSNVTAYCIDAYNGNPAVMIIDTPGFGDTRGIKQDIAITKQISNFFIDKLSSINAICFVCQSSNARLTTNQKYVFNSIFDLFGDDVKENFICMLTFCDGAKPVIVESLQSKKFMFSEIIPYIEEPWYYTFNNSGIFESGENNPLTHTFFDIGMKSFEEFTKRIIKLKPKSLDRSKDVLKERQALEKRVEILSEALTKGLNKIDEIKSVIKMVKNLKGDLNDSKNFKYKQKKIKLVHVSIPDGQLTTTCKECGVTCHKDCGCSNEYKYNCSAMNSKGYCDSCKGKCHWSSHINCPYIIEERAYEVEGEFAELKKKYTDSKCGLSVKTQMLRNLKKELINLNKECLDTQELITEGINKLKEIALNKSVFSTSEEYIEMLIQGEKQEQKEGYQIRIEGLQMLLKQKQVLRDVYENKGKKFDDMNRFINDSLTNEYKLDDESSECLVF